MDYPPIARRWVDVEQPAHLNDRLGDQLREVGYGTVEWDDLIGRR
jgi:hypothetical protein